MMTYGRLHLYHDRETLDEFLLKLGEPKRKPVGPGFDTQRKQTLLLVYNDA